MNVDDEQGMRPELSAAQKEARETFRSFARERIAPHAGEWDRDQRMPTETVDELRTRGYLGAPFPKEVGGGGMDLITYGLLTEELGRACSSTRTLLTVHDMACAGIQRWGNNYLKSEFLPLLTRGEKLGAFALTEPNVGSDARNIETEARPDGDHYVLDGCKKWISFGEMADLFLVFAHCEGKHAAFLVPADAPGFSRRPILGVMGTRATMLSELNLEGCRVPANHLIGRIGFGFSHVASAALEQGRYSVAWGSVGIAQGCLDACLDYT
ncbi:MAG: acyl-CoA dehydrogenase, partial [bacterium]|nr:acyl-CoA dehydrogenase [bacterium]